MDKEQNRKFEEWWDGIPKISRYHFDDRGQGYEMTKRAWQACLEANKIEKQEPEPTPTEMVRRLLENGWEIEQGITRSLIFFKHPPGESWTSHSIQIAYRKAFPPKRKIEVEVWMQQCPDNKHRVRETAYFGMALDETWTKGTATFLVEDSDET